MEVLVNLRRGKIQPQPSNCPDAVYAIMKSCWVTDPSIRDPAIEIEAKIAALLRAPASTGVIDASSPKTSSSRIMILNSLSNEDEDEMHL